MITTRLMKPGSWDLSLVPQTPKAVRDVLQPFGHIYVMEARLDPRIISDANVKALALYAGVVRRLPTPFSLAGAGMALWLGDEEGKGQFPDALGTWNLTNGTFVNWVGQFIVASITSGTVTAIAGTLTQNFMRQTARQCLDFVCSYFGGEYRVNNDASLDAGPPATIFPTTTAPTALLLPQAGGRDASLTGIEASMVNLAIDADSYTTKVLLVGATGTGTSTLTTPYKDSLGNLVQLERVVSNSQATAGQENAIAAAELQSTVNVWDRPRQEIKLSTNRSDIPHDVREGDWIYVYYPEYGLVDLTNQQNYRGQIVWPIKLRVFAITWPVEPGMAVFYRDGAGVYTDLTPWVVFEQPGTAFEVGAPERRTFQ